MQYAINHKNKCLITFIAIFCIGFFTHTSFASADVIAQQTSGSQSWGGSYSGYGSGYYHWITSYYNEPTPKIPLSIQTYSFLPNKLTIKIGTLNSLPVGQHIASVLEYSDSNCSTKTGKGIGFVYSSYATSTNLVTLVASSTVRDGTGLPSFSQSIAALDASKYYCLRNSSGTGLLFTTYTYGISSTHMPYYVLEGTNPALFSYIDTVTSPTQNSTTTSPVTISYKLYNAATDLFLFTWPEITNSITGENWGNSPLYNDHVVATTSLVTGLNTITQQISLPNGTYNLTFWGSINASGTSVANFSSTNNITFTVGNTIQTATSTVGVNFKDPWQVIADLGYSTSTCGVTSGEKILGCVIQAGITLLWPSEQSLARLTSIKDLISEKPPLGYFSLLKDKFTSISTTTGSGAFSNFDSIPTGLKTIIFNPIRSGMIALIGWMFVVHFWHRIKNLHIV